MRDIWGMQHRFEQRGGKRLHRLLAHPRFRAGYDFLLLRAESGEADPELAEWWTRFQEVDEEERNSMTREHKGGGRRRRRRKPRASSSGGNSQ
jgi:poly(A) polymerase